jgi:hypothetical protein
VIAAAKGKATADRRLKRVIEVFYSLFLMMKIK